MPQHPHQRRVERLAQDFTPESLLAFLRVAAPNFRPLDAPLSDWVPLDAPFDPEKAHLLGVLEWEAAQTGLVAAVHLQGELTNRSSKKKQFDLAKALIQAHNANAALLAFYDDAHRFRLSLVTVHYDGRRKTFSNWRRYTYFVAPHEPHRTFVEQLGAADFSSLDRLLEAFSVEPVTRDFFRTYEALFREAEESIALDWTPEQKRLYTQRFFNRLVFIAFLERKGWLRFQGRTDYLRALFEDYLQKEATEPQTNFHRARLNTLFFWGLNNARGRDERDDPDFALLRALIGDVPYLNGGLFEKEADDETWFFPDAITARILADLLYRFNFTVAESTPLDVEVAVDPEMLGKMFEEVVTGRHESGSYYTPKEVVSFMGQEALRFYLAEAVPDEDPQALEAFVYEGNATALRRPEAALEALRTVKVCDPACGSGAYLLGMLHELLDLRTALFTARRLDADTVYARKLEIIQNNLYGVDLDPFAVNIARLRLWLSLVVDYEGDTPPPLPNLDFKVEAGDSLTAPDPSGSLELGFRSKLVQQFVALKNRYLTLHEGGEAKQKLQQEIADLRASIQKWLGRNDAQQGFDWAVEFAEVFAPELAQGTLTGRMTGIVNMAPGQRELAPAPRPGGFDIVITNPPYVRQELLGKYKKRLKPVYPEVYNGTADLYVYFYARAQQLLRPGGVACFISSNKWLRAGYGEKLRRHLLDNQAFHLVVDFGELPVFQSAATFPAIFLWQKRPRDGLPTTWAVVRDLEEAYAEGLRAYVSRVAETLPAEQFGPGRPRLVSRRAAALRAQMEKHGVPLGEYVDQQIYFGIKTGYNPAFIIDAATRARLITEDPRSAEIIKPLLKGDDVRHYEIHDRQRFIIWTYIGVPIETYPTVFEHLSAYEEQLKKRQDQGKQWWELRACAYYDAFERPKIVYPDIGKRPRFYLDMANYFIEATAFVIPIHDWYLLGVLNSFACFEYVKSLASILGDENKGGRIRFKTLYMRNLPIPDASSKDRAALAALAQQTQTLHMERRARVEAFLQALGLPPAASNSRNPLERPWRLSEAEFQRRARRLPHPDPALFHAVRDETAELTERIAALEAEIDALVAELYGIAPPQESREQ